MFELTKEEWRSAEDQLIKLIEERRGEVSDLLRSFKDTIKIFLEVHKEIADDPYMSDERVERVYKLESVCWKLNHIAISVLDLIPKFIVSENAKIVERLKRSLMSSTFRVNNVTKFCRQQVVNWLNKDKPSLNDISFEGCMSEFEASLDKIKNMRRESKDPFITDERKRELIFGTQIILDNARWLCIETYDIVTASDVDHKEKYVRTTAANIKVKEISDCLKDVYRNIFDGVPASETLH